jgi:hypothetical protein
VAARVGVVAGVTGGADEGRFATERYEVLC